MIVDVLDDINRSTETVVAVQNAIHNASASSVHALEELNRNIGKTVRFVLIAIGLSIVAAALPQLGSAFAPEGRALKTAAPAVEVKNGAEDASAAEIADDNEAETETDTPAGQADTQNGMRASEDSMQG